MTTATRKLLLADIADIREYERTREEFREAIIAMKTNRRIHVGPVVTLIFENRDTMKFQIQEMARAEKMASDEAIQVELDVYNALIPETGELSATLFIELTNEVEMREWLPKLVGVERSIEIAIGQGDDQLVVKATVDKEHEEQLTREDITASVHYIRFSFTDSEVALFESHDVELRVNHPQYLHSVALTSESKSALLSDLR